ncbi:MAG: sulfotransferase family protein [Mycobacteriales bacterium]
MRPLRLNRLERRLAWIMGSPRSGSTWLQQLMSGDGVTTWQEPLVGAHLGLLSSGAFALEPRKALDQPRASDIRTDDRYFFSDVHAASWRPALRRLLLQRAAAQVSAASPLCVVHEPNGSEGADVIMSTLPNAYLVFLLRDGRDVVDSALDARKKGSWADTAFGGVGEEVAGSRRTQLLEEEAYRWATRTEVVARAFDNHDPARRVRVRYEDLLADTAGELRRIYEVLPIGVPADLEARVERLRFESIPADQRGAGRFHRAATPGLWRTNLSADDQQRCTEIMGPTLSAMGYSS